MAQKQQLSISNTHASKTAEDETAKSRNPQFSNAELTALMDEYSKKVSIINGNFKTRSDGALRRKRAWDEIAEVVNAVGGNERTLIHIKAKIKNIKSSTKKVASHNKREIRKTGGGEAELQDLTDEQQIMLKTLDNKQIEGIPGGIDLYEENASQTNSYVKISSADKLQDSVSQSQHNDCLALQVMTNRMDHETTEPCVIKCADAYESVNNRLTTFVARMSSTKATDNETPAVNNSDVPNKTHANKATQDKSGNNNDSSSARKKVPLPSRRSIFTVGPQEKLMQAQIDLFKKQVEVMEKIETRMAERNEIEKEKLIVMKVQLQFMMMPQSKNSNMDAIPTTEI